MKDVFLISQRITEVLINTHENIGGESRKKCTIEFLRCLKELGDKLTFETYSHGYNHEWLWDLVWSEENPNDFKKFERLFMVAEIEWNMKLTDLIEDFQKLLVAKAPIKLFVCQGCSDCDGKNLFDQLQKSFNFFSDEYKTVDESWIVFVSNKDFSYQLWRINENKKIEVTSAKNAVYNSTV